MQFNPSNGGTTILVVLLAGCQVVWCGLTYDPFSVTDKDIRHPHYVGDIINGSHLDKCNELHPEWQTRFFNKLNLPLISKAVQLSYTEYNFDDGKGPLPIFTVYCSIWARKIHGQIFKLTEKSAGKLMQESTLAVSKDTSGRSTHEILWSTIFNLIQKEVKEGKVETVDDNIVFDDARLGKLVSDLVQWKAA